MKYAIRVHQVMLGRRLKLSLHNGDRQEVGNV